MDQGEDAGIRSDFAAAVNMEPTELERWLGTAESKSVGQSGGGRANGGRSSGRESKGHANGRRIVEILRMDADKLSEDDYSHMRKVVNYVRRHRAQPPRANVRGSPWRYSLMNWGHDPLKEP